MSKVHPLISALLKEDDSIYVRSSKILSKNTSIPQRTLNQALEMLVSRANAYDMNSPSLVNTLDLLLEKGANPDISINWGTSTPLEFSYYNRRPDVVRVLLEHGAEISKELIDDVENQSQETPPSDPRYESQLQIMQAYLNRDKLTAGIIAERQAANVFYRNFESKAGKYSNLRSSVRKPGTFIPENVRRHASTFMGQRSSSNRRRRTNVQKAITRHQTAKKPRSVAGGGGGN
jgi:hypothetical protein